MSPCCPQLVLHHLFLSLPWKKVLGQASFRDPRLPKGLTVGTSQEEQSQTRRDVPCSLGPAGCQNHVQGHCFFQKTCKWLDDGTGDNLIPSESQRLLM